MMKFRSKFAPALAAAALVAVGASAAASEIPKRLVFTSYDFGSS